MPTTINPKLVSWASELDPGTLRQAEQTSRLPIVEGHVALMPDAHVGIGATVGSVIPTRGAVIPAAVGVDIGCGMVAAELDLTENQLPDDLGPLLRRIERVVPAGVGRGHSRASRAAGRWLADHRPGSELSQAQAERAAGQFGTLGSGNHFLELCVDERGRLWVVLHSGSRGIGNQLAEAHIATAKQLARQAMTPLEDPNLAYFVQGTPEFDAYLADMLWAQAYARANRDQMMDAALAEVRAFLGAGEETGRVNSHHNFTELEVHGGKELWITRKGAIRARRGDLGVIPGSMGTSTYIVAGRGEPASFESCAHGAGRRLSRGQARRQLSVQSLRQAMAGRTWNQDHATSLLDEHPESYKPIDVVMEDQKDLVEVLHTLRQVLNYKGG
ncbi:MAG: RtcB family protein [Acidimicrobiales bacterium]|nr:RtcB family protein [Acidimicrobiales bacterium]MBO0894614.1 RtcB family protein [Acidimicrobiales bacterium]